jgi:hypothetical protein
MSLFTDRILQNLHIRWYLFQPNPLPPVTLLSYLLGEPAFLLVVRIPIHSSPWFAINCPPFATSPNLSHPTDQVTIFTYIDDINNISRPRLTHYLSQSSFNQQIIFTLFSLWKGIGDSLGDAHGIMGTLSAKNKKLLWEKLQYYWR